MKYNTPEEKLNERIKELSCLYDITKTIAQCNGIEKGILEKIILTLKKAWRFPEDCIVEIQINGYILTTATIPKKTVSQYSPIYINNVITGFIKVHYPQPKYLVTQFLKDEQDLLDTVSLEVTNYIEKYKNLERKDLLRRAVERKDRLAILGEMTAGIAHELNTPLGNILGFAELINDHTNDTQVKEDITRIINSAIYSREIVKKLMYFSCEVPQQLQLQKIKPIVTDALSFLKQNFQKKEIQSQLDFEDEDIIAKIDSIQLTQVLFNILINAIHAVPKKSVIKTIVKSDTKNLLITIKDNGSGIPNAIKQRIFHPFFTTKNIKEGSGLGLSVVHRIVKNHKGEINVTDNIPTGAIFLIKLPLYQ
ncbi:ATP-binding protein [Flavobacterium sp. LS1R49]|uniref:histidine kinase n=1 Tax=Flavobacterium shii TaxID=2987687 RepID=A0A9X3C5Y5_9FLAO|nr:ATP-binding protein [Flavobacterium shii]MCV9928557.1 ATP-binding protein [Flavobacterium shii]